MGSAGSLVDRPLLYSLKRLFRRPAAPSPGDVVGVLDLEGVGAHGGVLYRLKEDAQFDSGPALAGLAFRGDIIHEAQDSLMAGADSHVSRRLQTAIVRRSREPGAAGNVSEWTHCPLDPIGAFGRIGGVAPSAGYVEVLVDGAVPNLVIGAEVVKHLGHAVGPEDKQQALQVVGWDEAPEVPVHCAGMGRALSRHGVEDELTLGLRGGMVAGDTLAMDREEPNPQALNQDWQRHQPDHHQEQK